MKVSSVTSALTPSCNSDGIITPGRERERELLPPGSTKGNMFEAARDKPQRAEAVNELTAEEIDRYITGITRYLAPKWRHEPWNYLDVAAQISQTLP